MVAAKDFTGLDLTGLTSDSRKVEPGYLFAALAGSKTDGARFLPDAVARGARAVLGAARNGGGRRGAGRGLHRRRKSPAAPGADGGGFLWRPARHGRRRHRHQGQILHRRLPARDLDRSWASPPPAWARWAWSGPRAKCRSTTPRPIRWRSITCWRELKRDGVEHLAIEASSHGLDQYRLDGVLVAGAAFTNITRDHMDYHATFEDYLKAKLRLFTEVVAEGGVARGQQRCRTCGRLHRGGEDARPDLAHRGRERARAIKLISRQSKGDAQALAIVHGGQDL